MINFLNSILKFLYCIFPCLNKFKCENKETKENLKVVVQDENLVKKESVKKLASKPRDIKRPSKEKRLNSNQTQNKYWYQKQADQAFYCVQKRKHNNPEETIVYCFINIQNLNDYQLIENPDHKNNSGKINKKAKSKFIRRLLLKRIKSSDEPENLVFRHTSDEENVSSDEENDLRTREKKPIQDVEMLDASIVKMDIDESSDELDIVQNGKVTLDLLSLSFSDLELKKKDKSFKTVMLKSVEETIKRLRIKHKEESSYIPCLIFRFKFNEKKIVNRNVYSFKEEILTRSKLRNSVSNLNMIMFRSSKLHLPQTNSQDQATTSAKSENRITTRSRGKLEKETNNVDNQSVLVSSKNNLSSDESDDNSERFRKINFKSSFTNDSVRDSKLCDQSFNITKKSTNRASKHSLDQVYESGSNETNSKRIRKTTEINTVNETNSSKSRTSILSSTSVPLKPSMNESKSKVKDAVSKLEKRLSIHKGSQTPSGSDLKPSDFESNQKRKTTDENSDKERPRKTRSGVSYPNLGMKSQKKEDSSDEDNNASNKKRRK